MLDINRKLDCIFVSGDVVPGTVHRLLAVVHKAVNDAGFSEIKLDMSACTKAWPDSMLQICAQALSYRVSGIHIVLNLPEKQDLRRLFINTNWANLIDPIRYDEGCFRGHSKIPATQYKTPSEQQQIVDRVVRTALASTTNCSRSEIQAFEWAINEITDNVLVHANSSSGGLVQVSYFHQRRQIMFVVADAGSTIPTTLREGYPDILSDTDALDRALREGVTRDSSIGQGNGLFGTFQICQMGEGSFTLNSGHAFAMYTPEKGLHIRGQQIPYGGTLVVARLDFSQPGLLENALRISDKVHHPVDFIETNYESDDSGDINFIIKDEAKSVGSRAAGEPLRRRLINLANMTSGNHIFLDFTGIPLISSSFADEVVAKLFAHYGAVEFMTRFQIVNADRTVSALINKSIQQRTKTGI